MRFFTLFALACVPSLAPSTAAPVPKPGPPRVLVASSNKDGNWNIYLVQASTGEVKRLTDHKGIDTNPVWSPDGKRLAFISNRDGTENLWTMKFDGTDLTQLTRGKHRWLLQLQWSPDGSRIAYTAGREAGLSDICAVEVATGKVARLGEGGNAITPSWSPDGKQLVYSSIRVFAEWHTRRVNADGTGDEKFTDGLIYPRWSPDGKRVACVQALAGSGDWKVHTFGADGKDKTLVGVGECDVQWSPDSKRLCFVHRTFGVPIVVVANADGTGTPLDLTKREFARWSPDGKSLSYVRQAAPGRFVLTVSDPDGKNGKDLLPGVEAAAEWQPK